jgi:hypothetical protein
MCFYCMIEMEWTKVVVAIPIKISFSVYLELDFTSPKNIDL